MAQRLSPAGESYAAQDGLRTGRRRLALTPETDVGRNYPLFFCVLE